ncbi:MAG: hypothetical protein J5705_03745 [Bacteroidaceae bacterium]|nr:hypothetical protein [Bacteroidaceae bacterium]
MKRRSILRGLFLSLLTTVGFGQVYAQSGFDPQPPSDPQYHYYYPVTVAVSPEGAGYASGSGKYEAGTVVWINTSPNSGYVFDHWEKDGVFYSNEQSFNYTMGEERPKFVAFYTYDPNAPSDPENTYQPKKRLYLTCPQNECSFNQTSGGKQVIGSTVRVVAYPNQGYQVIGWYLDDELLSASNGFDYVMPDHDVTLRVEVEYRPQMPGDPASQGGDIALESDNLDDINPYTSNSLFSFEKIEATYTGKPFDFTYFSKFNPEIKVLNGDFATGVGSYTAQIDVTIKNDSMDTHRVFSYDYRILPAPLTLKADNATKVYGEDNPALSFSANGFVNNENVTNLVGKLSVRSDVNKSTGVGDYTIEIDGVSSTNYDITFENGTLTVTKAPLTITANDATIKYGDDLPSDWSYTIAGFVNNDDESVLTVQPSGYVEEYSGNAGTYSIVLSGAESTNYYISYVPGTLTVEQSGLTLTVDNATKVYGEENPQFSYTITDANGIVVTGVLDVEPTLSSEATAESGVGEYSVIAEGASSQNYAINVVNGTLTVTKATIAVYAENATKVYGEENPQFTFSAQGFVNNDDISCFTQGVQFTTTADATSGAGEYAITPSGGETANYEITEYHDGTLTINKAPLTIIVNDLSVEYGTELTQDMFQYSYRGFVNGDDASCLTVAPSVDLSNVGTDVGTYTLTAYGAESANYEISYMNGALAIGQSMLTLQVLDATKVYGESNPEFTYTVTDGAGNDMLAELNIMPTLSTAATTMSGVGEYEIIAKGALSQNYSINVKSGILTITKAPLTVAAADLTKVYGENNPDMSYSISGFVNNDNATVFTNPVRMSTEVNNTTPVGEYPIVAYNATAENYDITFVDGTFTVTKAPLTITANDATVSYGDDISNYEWNYTVTGFVNNDNEESLTIKPAVTIVDFTGDAGTYTIAINGAESANYEISYVNGTLTVGQSVLTLKVEDASKVYGEENPQFSYVIQNANGEIIGGVLDVEPTLSTTATATSGVGEYEIIADGALSQNYSINVVNGTLTITKAPLTITAVDATKVYGEDNPEFAYTVEGFINNDDASCFIDNVKYNTEAGKTSGVGEYALVPYGASAANYEIEYVEGLFTITKAPLTITVKGAMVSYGYDLSNYTFQFGYEGFVNGDTEESLTVKPQVDLNTVGTEVGTYTLTAYGAESDNYEITYVDGTLSIGQSVLTLTVQNATKVYGEENPAFEYTITDLDGNDQLSELNELPTLTTTATKNSGVGEYDITATGAVSHNFAINVVDGKLTITKAPAVVVAENATKVYGAENPAFTYSVNGLVEGDDISAISDVKFRTEADKTTGVGDYEVIPYAATAVNYEIAGYESAILTITKAPLTISVKNVSVAYGFDLSNYQFEFSYEGFVNGETADVLTSQPEVSINDYSGEVGTYTLTAYGADAANYEITYVDGLLAVGQSALVITVDNASKVYGEENPEFTYIVTDMAGNDQAAALSVLPELKCEATAASGVGEYAITATGAVSANYSITVVDGTLTITKAPLTITANDLTKVYGSNNPDMSYSIEGLLNGDNAATAFTDRIRMKTEVVNATGVGEYPIVVYNATAANYDITFVDGTFTVTKAPLTITVKNVTVGYGYNLNNYTFQFGYEGFVNGDTEDNLTVKPQIDFATIGTDVGTYTLTAYGAESPNYDITYVDGTLSIGQSVLTITVQNATKVYGEENPSFEYTVTDMEGNDMLSELDERPTLTTTATAASGVGEYDITATGATSHNFAINVIDGKLTVTKAPVEIIADYACRVYGAEDPDFTFSVEGLVNNDSVNAIEGVMFRTNADKTSSVGAYTITPYGGSAVNYEITGYIDGLLDIVRAPLTITVKNVTVDYGFDMSYYQYEFIYEGFVNGDTPDVLDSKPLVEIENYAGGVGTYTLIVWGAGDQNYEISFVNGLLAVGQSVMVIAVDNATMVYGSDMPEFTYTVTDMEGNDLSWALEVQPTILTKAVAGDGVGEYPVWAEGAVSSNYSISYVEATLTITKAPLLITPKDITINFGDNIYDLKLEYIYEGFVNGDTEDCLTVKPKIKLPTNLSQSGEYDLVAYGAEAANYEISYGTGKLTIDKSVLFLAVKSVSREYGEENPKFEYAVVDASGTNMISALTKQPEIKCVATTTSPVGTYDIIAEGAESDNYSINVVNGKLQVTPATLTVTAHDAEFEQGAELSFSYTITGFKNGEDESVLTKLPVLTCNATAQSAAGTYVITASGAEAANYVFVYVNGTLNLTTGVMGIEIDGVNIIYDITGKKIDSAIDDLKPGMYIINGRKYVVQ